MRKNRLLLVPFFAGLLLMLYSWWLSYPLSTNSASDVIFNHVSFFYWVSLPLVLGSMFLMGATTKNIFLKWLLTIGILLTLYSIFYFYLMLPTSDSQFFRGLNEYFAVTRSLDASQLNHLYYQWPSFFILTYISTSISGINLINFEFILFSVIGFLLVTSLFVYFYQRFKNGAFFAVISFFVSIFYFVNYQAVPFSLAFGIFFIILMLETIKKSSATIIIQILLYVGILFTHTFVPLFFVIYLLIQSILKRSRLYFSLFLFSIASYLVVQLTIASFSFKQTLSIIFAAPQEFGYISRVTFAPVVIPTDSLAQLFSRTVTIGFVLTCVAGFIFLLIKKRLTVFDKSLLITGISYTALGIVINTLGYRAIPIALIPISLGTAFIFEGKFRKYFVGIFLVLIMLFVFIPIHQSFTSDVQYQTITDYRAENFLIDTYNWENSTRIIAGFRVATYIQPKLENYELIDTEINHASQDDAMVYTVELSKVFLSYNTTLENLIQSQNLNKIYDNGMASVEVRANR